MNYCLILILMLIFKSDILLNIIDINFLKNIFHFFFNLEWHSGQ